MHQDARVSHSLLDWCEPVLVLWKVLSSKGERLILTRWQCYTSYRSSRNWDSYWSDTTRYGVSITKVVRPTFMPMNIVTDLDSEHVSEIDIGWSSRSGDWIVHFNSSRQMTSQEECWTELSGTESAFLKYILQSRNFPETPFSSRGRSRATFLPEENRSFPKRLPAYSSERT